MNNFVNSMLTDYLDTKAVNIRSRQGRNKYDQSEVGMFIIDALSPGESSQIYIGSSMICFTNDSWLTCQTCLDGNGLAAKTLVGEIIAGHNLMIGNENNTFVIDGDGITIKGNHLYIEIDGENNDSFTSYIQMLKDEISTKVAKGEEFYTEFSQTAEDFNFKIGKDGMNVNINKDALDVRGGAIQVWNKDNTKKMIYLGSDGNAVFGGDIKLELASNPNKYVAIKAVPYATDIGCKLVLGGNTLNNAFSIEDKNTVRYFWVNYRGTHVSNNLYIVSDQRDVDPIATSVAFDDGTIYPEYDNKGMLGTVDNRWMESNIITGRFYDVGVTNTLYVNGINVESEISNLWSRISSVDSDVSWVSTRVSSLSSSVSSLSSRVSSLSSRVSALESAGKSSLKESTENDVENNNILANNESISDNYILIAQEQQVYIEMLEEKNIELENKLDKLESLVNELMNNK